jgi:hypothetical protein
MTTIELAERKAQARALVYLVFAVLELLVLAATFQRWATDFVGGFWVGMTLVAALNMLPFARWFRPRSPTTRLLDDETTREHRHLSAVAGFWAALAVGLALALLSPAATALSGFDVARLIVTAALVAALTRFALLELRAGAA